MERKNALTNRNLILDFLEIDIKDDSFKVQEWMERLDEKNYKKGDILCVSKLIKFFTDWNWIHYVFEKIKETKYPVTGHKSYENFISNIDLALKTGEKNRVINSICDFIIWWKAYENKIILDINQKATIYRKSREVEFLHARDITKHILVLEERGPLFKFKEVNKPWHDQEKTGIKSDYTNNNDKCILYTGHVMLEDIHNKDMCIAPYKFKF